MSLAEPGPPDLPTEEMPLGPPRTGPNGLRYAGAVLLPLCVVVALLAVWHLAVALSSSKIFPTPIDVARGIAEQGRDNVLQQ